MQIRQQTIGGKTLRTIRLWAPIVVVYGIILFLASARYQTGAPAPSLSYEDKIHHFVFYGFVGTLLHRALPRHLTRVYSWVLAFVLTAGLGLIDEICQYYNPGRTGDLLDWSADCFGALCAILLYNWARPYRRFIEFSPVEWAVSKKS